MAHIYRAFLTEELYYDPINVTRVDNGAGFAVSIDGHSYHFARFSTAVRTVERELAQRLLEACTGYLLLHAATVADKRGMIVAVGPSGAGKTTVALELVRRGMRYFTDEFTVIQGPVIHPFPRSAVRKFDGPTATGSNLKVHYGDDFRAYLLPDRRAGLQSCALQCPRIIFLDRVAQAPASVRTIGPGEACSRLMPSVIGFRGRETALWPALSGLLGMAHSCVFEYSDVERDLGLALDHLGVM
ncbi:MAG: hypothetical protein GY732_13455 [Gammaproteobacteria bacterium]|nr:hypothetical protein [Gammaproteobacteria bacterium]